VREESQAGWTTVLAIFQQLLLPPGETEGQPADAPQAQEEKRGANDEGYVGVKNFHFRVAGLEAPRALHQYRAHLARHFRFKFPQQVLLVVVYFNCPGAFAPCRGVEGGAQASFCRQEIFFAPSDTLVSPERGDGRCGRGRRRNIFGRLRRMGIDLDDLGHIGLHFVHHAVD